LGFYREKGESPKKAGELGKKSKKENPKKEINNVVTVSLSFFCLQKPIIDLE